MPESDVSDASSLSSNLQDSIHYSVVGSEDSVDNMDWMILEMNKAIRSVEELVKFKKTSLGSLFWDKGMPIDNSIEQVPYPPYVGGNGNNTCAHRRRARD
ncbi:hypothetical protein GJ496_007503 [Pomphorhynchus laevis]|nr:hypothetical protein GJ496_007503 [Pomphorhynchus laevis]